MLLEDEAAEAVDDEAAVEAKGTGAGRAGGEELMRLSCRTVERSRKRQRRLYELRLGADRVQRGPGGLEELNRVVDGWQGAEEGSRQVTSSPADVDPRPSSISTPPAQLVIISPLSEL